MVSTDKITDSQKVSSTYKLLAIDESVGGYADSPVEKEIEALLLWAYQTLGSEQLIKAKEQFYWKTGKIFPDDYFFANRISYFIDHFLFERPIETEGSYTGQTPYQSYLSASECSIEPSDHSVFSVLKVNPNSLNIKSLITGQKFTVQAREQERLDGISKSDVFQSYIYKFDDNLFLSKGIIFHPFRAYRAIRKNIKKSINLEDFQSNLLLHKLARQQLRQCRHEHVDPRKFYLDDQI